MMKASSVARLAGLGFAIGGLAAWLRYAVPEVGLALSPLSACLLLIPLAWPLSVALRRPSGASILAAVSTVALLIVWPLRTDTTRIDALSWAASLIGLVFPIAWFWLRPDRVQAWVCLLSFALGCASVPGIPSNEVALGARSIGLASGLLLAFAAFRVDDARPPPDAATPWGPRSPYAVVAELASTLLVWATLAIALVILASPPIRAAGVVDGLDVAAFLVITAVLFQQLLGVLEGPWRPSTTSPWITTRRIMALVFVLYEAELGASQLGSSINGRSLYFVVLVALAFLGTMRLMHLGGLIDQASTRGSSHIRAQLWTWSALDGVSVLLVVPLSAPSLPSHVVAFVLVSVGATLTVVSRLRIRRLELQLSTASLADEFGPAAAAPSDPLPADPDPT